MNSQVLNNIATSQYMGIWNSSKNGSAFPLNPQNGDWYQICEDVQVRGGIGNIVTILIGNFIFHGDWIRLQDVFNKPQENESQETDWRQDYYKYKNKLLED